MRNLFFRIMLAGLIFSFLTGCQPCKDRDVGGKIVAQVNKYKMSVSDLKYELENLPYDEKHLMDTESGRGGYLDRLLEREILIQEAQRQGLDKEDDFMKSIENYWEQALLKLLLQKKSKEISSLVHVYDDEVEEYYRDSGEDLSLPKVKSDIRRILRQKKETEAMDAWIEELKKRSYIRINKDVLDQMF